ncbi:MAG: UDP-2,3-diacylglucosamine diphosphatase [Gammaproteobacteria bacterium]
MLKQKAKGYLEYLYEFESQVARQAQIRNFDGVICGHTHTAKIIEIDDMIYMNDGDWVDSCTAIVEHHDGNFEIISWREKSKQLNLGIEEFYQ